VTLTLPVREVQQATTRARIVKLDLAGVTFSYRPGQAVYLAAPGSHSRRAYSIAAAPEDAERTNLLELLVGVDDEGRTGGGLQFEPGTLVDVDGPLGRFVFPDHPDEDRFAFIAGGTGIAPLRAMLHHALLIPHDKICVLYSARTSADFAYEDELRALAREGRIDFWQTVTREHADEASWTGARGRIGRETLAPLVDDPLTLCFICGPRALVDEIPKLLIELGVAPGRIRIEEW
jgi:ferredoxin-NADP reductase